MSVVPPPKDPRLELKQNAPKVVLKQTPFAVCFLPSFLFSSLFF